ncbi:MAG: metallophosphoesterase family protein [Planctomycetota bacterium]
MRIGILGDIHGNLEALTAVVDAMRAEHPDLWVQVGDLVGYGPDPGPCIELVRGLGCLVCMGNHDAAVLDLLDTAYFNNFAREAVEWTKEHLPEEHLSYLRSLGLVVHHPEFTVVHGTLHMPEQFGYVISAVEAMDSLALQQSRVCFVGHSHVPAIYMKRDQGDLFVAPYQPEIRVDTAGFARVLVNVGSVGQPRDEDPRATFALYDTETEVVEIRRVVYDIRGVQEKILRAGLPPMLANRLSLGV